MKNVIAELFYGEFKPVGVRVNNLSDLEGALVLVCELLTEALDLQVYSVKPNQVLDLVLRRRLAMSVRKLLLISLGQRELLLECFVDMAHLLS